jgi:hypothetical protein
MICKQRLAKAKKQKTSNKTQEIKTNKQSQKSKSKKDLFGWPAKLTDLAALGSSTLERRHLPRSRGTDGPCQGSWAE